VVLTDAAQSQGWPPTRQRRFDAVVKDLAAVPPGSWASGSLGCWGMRPHSAWLASGSPLRIGYLRRPGRGHVGLTLLLGAGDSARSRGRIALAAYS